MLSLQAKIRETSGREVKELRKQDMLPAILYGPEVKSQALVLDYKEFEKIYEEAGESTLTKLKIKDKEFQVLIHDIQKQPVTGRFLHVDFYQPKLKEKIELSIPLVFKGEAPAVRELGGVLVKNISEVKVRAFPQNLPKEIEVDVARLKSFESIIQIKDIEMPPEVEILKEPEEVIALVAPPEEIKEEKPAEKGVPVSKETSAEGKEK